jgi:oxaloacetate decarboxylase alpha subunit/pyruvate carboxylase subunit B
MPGMIVSYEKDVGDAVSQGETVVILEAMKMENSLPAPASGTLKAVNFSSGDTVAKGDVLAVIE